LRKSLLTHLIVGLRTRPSLIETLLQDGTIQTSDVELKDTFVADVKENLLHIDGDMSR
jgi:hypothetical protein